MPVLPLGNSRVSTLLQGSVSANQIDQAQSQLLIVENELSTGKAVNVPSDNPSASSMIIQLQQTLNRSQSYSDTINATTAQLSQADSSLGTLTTLLQQAEQIASADVGTNVTQSQRTSDVAVVKSIYDQVLSLSNQQYNGAYLFGGATGTTQPFTEVNGNVQFNATGQTLQNSVNDGLSVTFQVDGAKIFGALATGVKGTANLSPALTNATRISDLGGINGSGIQLGVIQISNGTVTKSVDLSADSSVGDVINSINLAAVGGITAASNGQGITISGLGTENITISGQTASDLGINTAAAGAGVGTPVIGGSLNPAVTLLTPIATLKNGAGISNAGLKITNAGTTKTITWPAGGTVQDLLNSINGAGLGVLAQINNAGTGINISNATQGTSLSIGENGGTSAADLGLQTFSSTTSLASLNGGKGVPTAGVGTPDFQINAQDGTVIPVTLNGAVTVQDVLNKINTAAAGKVTATLSTSGSGIVLTDTTGGGGALSLTALNNSGAAAGLGLTGGAVGNKITGTDTGALASGGIFGNLQALMAAMQSGNQQAITAAGTGIASDTARVIEVHGQTGAVEQELTAQTTQIQQQNTATQSLVSQLQNIDYAQVATQYQTLQTALQASLEVAAKTLSVSLMNFIR